MGPFLDRAKDLWQTKGAPWQAYCCQAQLAQDQDKGMSMANQDTHLVKAGIGIVMEKLSIQRRLPADSIASLVVGQIPRLPNGTYQPLEPKHASYVAAALSEMPGVKKIDNMYHFESFRIESVDY